MVYSKLTEVKLLLTEIKLILTEMLTLYTHFENPLHRNLKLLFRDNLAIK